MIENLLEHIKIFALIEHIFAVAAMVMTAVVFISCLLHYKKGETTLRRPVLILGMILVFVVALYGSSVVFAKENTEPETVFVIENEDWPEKSEFSEETKVWVNAEGVSLWIEADEILQTKEIEQAEERKEGPYERTKDYACEQKQAGRSCLVFDVPDGTAFSFVVQARRDESVDASISFIINKKKNEPDLTPETECPGDPVITQAPGVTTEPLLPEIQEIAQDPEQGENPEPGIQSVETTVPEVEELPAADTEAVEQPAADKETENLKAHEAAGKPSSAEAVQKDKPDLQKEDYTATIRHDGSVFITSSETQKTVESIFLSEPSQLTIIEVNKERVETRNVTYTLNGETVILDEDHDFSVTEEKTKDGWRYIYHLQEDLFDKDGYYQINITSTDRGGKKNNNKTAGMGIQFVVDRTAPEIILSGLENNKTYKDVPHVYYLTVRDNTGLEMLLIYKNGEMEEELWYKDGKWVNRQEEVLVPDGGTLKLELDTRGKACDYRFEAVDKSRNVSFVDVLRVRTVKKHAGVILVMSAVAVAALCAIVIRMKRKRKSRTRI